jgi:hypothetical protein
LAWRGVPHAFMRYNGSITAPRRVPYTAHPIFRCHAGSAFALERNVAAPRILRD